MAGLGLPLLFQWRDNLCQYRAPDQGAFLLKFLRRRTSPSEACTTTGSLAIFQAHVRLYTACRHATNLRTQQPPLSNFLSRGGMVLLNGAARLGDGPGQRETLDAMND